MVYRITHIEPINGAYGNMAKITFNNGYTEGVLIVNFDEMGRVNNVQLKGMKIQEDWYSFYNGSLAVYLSGILCIMCAGFTEEEDKKWSS